MRLPFRDIQARFGARIWPGSSLGRTVSACIATVTSRKTLIRPGFTVVELLVCLILLSLIMGAVYHSLFQAQHTAREVTANQVLNDTLHRLMNRITDDVREGNIIHPTYPPTVQPTAVASLRTSDPNNKLVFEKIHLDFSKDPRTLAPDQKIYTKTKVEYAAEREGPDKPWFLRRTATPIDDFGNPVEQKKTIRVVAEGLDEVIFYRLDSSSSPRAGNVFCNVTLARRKTDTGMDANYGVSFQASVMERGNEP